MTIDTIKKLYYQEGLSAKEVGEKTGKTVWQIIRIMKKSHLRLRKNSETQRIQFFKKPLSFNKKTILSFVEKKLNYCGLMLYWAEGSKTDNGVVDFANSDKKMLLIFLDMLRRIYRVDEIKLRILLYCYANQNPDILTDYWANKFKIPKAQFIKPYIRYDYNQDKTYKMPHGLVHIRYNDKRLFMKIWQDIDIMASTIIDSTR